MPYCQHRTIVNADDDHGTIHALRCKMWSCPTCREHNRRQVMHKARKGQPNVFFTLTCDPSRYETPDQAARDMKRGLVLLRRHIERRWKVRNIPFIVVFEKHKSGWPHMHLLLRGPYMHWKNLRAMWTKILGAWSIDIRFIRKQSQVLFYVTKYIGKDLAAFQGCKRYWSSHNWQTINDENTMDPIIGPYLVQLPVPFALAAQWLPAQLAQVENEHRTKMKFRRDPNEQLLDWRGLIRLACGIGDAPADGGREVSA